jgi:hypothetical protein
VFFQESKGFVRDLLSCLDEKVPLIDSLERRLHRSWKDAADRVTARRGFAACDTHDSITELLTGMRSYVHATLQQVLVGYLLRI